MPTMAWYVDSDGDPIDLDTIRDGDGRASADVTRVVQNPDGSLTRTKWAREGTPLRPIEVEVAQRDVSDDDLPDEDDDTATEWPGGQVGGGGSGGGGGGGGGGGSDSGGGGGGLITDLGAPNPADERFEDTRVKGYLDVDAGLVYKVARETSSALSEPMDLPETLEGRAWAQSNADGIAPLTSQPGTLAYVTEWNSVENVMVSLEADSPVSNLIVALFDRAVLAAEGSLHLAARANFSRANGAPEDAIPSSSEFEAMALGSPVKPVLVATVVWAADAGFGVGAQPFPMEFYDMTLPPLPYPNGAGVFPFLATVSLAEADELFDPVFAAVNGGMAGEGTTMEPGYRLGFMFEKRDLGITDVGLAADVAVYREREAVTSLGFDPKP